MTLCKRSFIAVVLCTAIAAGFGEAKAQALPEARIAVVNFQLIQKNSTAMVDIQSQIEQRRQLYQDEITLQEKDIRADEQELVRQRSVLSADAFALKRREFEAKVAQVQRVVQDRKRELDQAFEFGTNQVQLMINDIISELSKEKNFNIVLSRQQIVYTDSALNISDDVILILNERLPLVAVPAAQN